VADTDLVNGIRLMEETAPAYWVTYPNFQVITTYNRSRMYAMAVWQLGQAIVEVK
jgi:membrane-bound lytic murein transglycosylase B